MKKKEVENKNKHKKRELNPRQKKFCLEYIKRNNATQSAINAGYSERTAYSIGQRMLKNVEIKEYIEKHTQKALSKKGMEADEILFRISQFANHEIFEEEIHTEEISEKGKRIIRKKKTASLHALQLLAKYSGLENLKDNKEVSSKPLIDQFFDRVLEPAEERGIDL